MNGFFAVRTFGLALVFATAHAAAADHPSPAPLPTSLAMNEDAGRGGWLLVTARLDSGREALLALDTGSSQTVFDKSFASNLTKLEVTAVIRGWDGNQNTTLYQMPRLELGGATLLVDGPAATIDLTSLSALAGRHLDGVLGMNCLHHYCLQLDFSTGQIRFLDNVSTNHPAWGKAFPLTDFSRTDARPAVAGNLAGAAAGRSIIDSGDNTEGWLRPEFYRPWTNLTASPLDAGKHAPSGKFGGESYTDLNLREAKVASDGIGLRFLSRHLVTFDFPNQTLYLKRTSDGPLPPKGVAELLAFVKELKARGELPGWTKGDPGTFLSSRLDSPSGSGTIETQKTGDPSTYHYKVARLAPGASWKLEKAWRTDASNRLIEEYPVK